MGEGPANSTPSSTANNTSISTPATRDTTTGSATETHGMNTNLDPNMQGGPISPADQAATKEIKEEHAEQGSPAGTQDPHSD